MEGVAEMSKKLRYKPKVGEICAYYGMKFDLRGASVICVNHKDKFAVWIQAYSSGTKWDTDVWSCSTSFLRPLVTKEPDWEV